MSMLKQACQHFIDTVMVMNKVGGKHLEDFNNELVGSRSIEMVEILKKDFEGGVEAIKLSLIENGKTEREFYCIMREAHRYAVNLLNNK